jgi:hypothetical protein
MAIDFVIVRGMDYEPQLRIVNGDSPIQTLGERLDNRLQFAGRIRRPGGGWVRNARHLSTLASLLADDPDRWTGPVPGARGWGGPNRQLRSRRAAGVASLAIRVPARQHLGRHEESVAPDAE